MADTLTPQVEDVHGSGIYPGSGPRPSGDVLVRTPAQLGHPEVRRYRVPGSLDALEKTAHLFGRALFGGYFVYNGINHFKNHGMMTEYARSKGVPAPGAAVAISGALIVAGGLSVITGAWPKVGDEAGFSLTGASCTAEAVARVPARTATFHRGRLVSGGIDKA